MKTHPFDLSEIQFVKRVVVGNSEPSAVYTEEDAQQALGFLNRCLSESPKGRIVGMEKNFNVLNMGEHQIVMQWLVYHVGFSRKPHWIE